MTPRALRSFASSAFACLLPLLGAMACGPETHIVGSMDPDAAAGTGGATSTDVTGGASGMGTGDSGAPGVPEPAARCDNGVQDGDETDIDCGGACAACDDGQRCNIGADCTSAACEDELCVRPTCNDGVRNGDETSVDCGGEICSPCAVSAFCRVDSDCTSGLCVPGTNQCGLVCDRGTAECDGDLGEECETNLLTSVRNCGECGNACDLPHGSASCTGGACAIDECDAGFDDCDGDPADGCETNISTAVNNCGGCGIVCEALPGGSVSCLDGRCGFFECDAGFADCDGKVSNGCETEVENDVENCGRCGVICESVHATTACTDGACEVTSCDAGWGDCDGDADDGCETNFAIPATCGSCAHACQPGEMCSDGDCITGACDGICESTDVVVIGGYELRRDNIGTGEFCQEVLAWEPGESPGTIACWDFASPRTLELNGEAVTCDAQTHAIEVLPRAGQFCVHAGAGDFDFAGFVITP